GDTAASATSDAGAVAAAAEEAAAAAAAAAAASEHSGSAETVEGLLLHMPSSSAHTHRNVLPPSAGGTSLLNSWHASHDRNSLGQASSWQDSPLHGNRHLHTPWPPHARCSPPQSASDAHSLPLFEPPPPPPPPPSPLPPPVALSIGGLAGGETSPLPSATECWPLLAPVAAEVGTPASSVGPRSSKRSPSFLPAPSSAAGASPAPVVLCTCHRSSSSCSASSSAAADKPEPPPPLVEAGCVGIHPPSTPP
ncbi:unnamed protein product, partial [Ectocarpus sp. 8 AP-2014]